MEKPGTYYGIWSLLNMDTGRRLPADACFTQRNRKQVVMISTSANTVTVRPG
ncbi:hypothetical protein [Microbulbifer halophilus]|uniref:hypothetical protein n=1 Tax=Microbulbifer halophilus TaxID=453963 RepID=UPI00361208B3